MHLSTASVRIPVDLCLAARETARESSELGVW